jgi:hypothetical protein
MTSIGFGGGANMMRLLQQQLFAQIDGNADGAISKTEMETAVSDAGGTTEQADSGSVNAEQFVSGLKSSLIGDGTLSQLIDVQDVGEGREGGYRSGGAGAFLSKLLSSIDSDGAVTKSELEDAVTSAGGTTEQADALYGKLDPDDSGSATEAEFTQAMMPPMMGPPPPPPGASDDAADASDATVDAASDSSSGSATDAPKLLLEAIESAEEAQYKSASARATDDAASAAFQRLLDSLDASSAEDESGARQAGRPNPAAAQQLVQHYVLATSSTTAARSTISAVA